LECFRPKLLEALFIDALFAETKLSQPLHQLPPNLLQHLQRFRSNRSAEASALWIG
jgi:hypothetical protein